MYKPTYTQRNVLLTKLGFSSYAEYLSSVLWAEIREAVLDRDNRICKLCNGTAKAVHHTNYDEATLLGDSLGGLVSICMGCHKKVELNYRNEKRTLVESQQAFNKLLSRKWLTLIKIKQYKRKSKRIARKLAKRKKRLGK